MSDDKRGDSRSGPCLTRQHDRCRYAACTCTAPECPHANHVAAQAETGEIGYAVQVREAAPAVLVTPLLRGLTPMRRG